MKGEDTFTNTEIQNIKELISKKVEATKEEQKSIRAKIRKIGFYYTDFSLSKHGYTVADFDSLICSGQIKINNDGE